MKKYLMASALLASATLSVSALAADGVIHFTGKISDNVCNVSPTLNVAMGDIAIEKLVGVGTLSDPKNFELVLTDCPLTLKTAQVKFDGAADANDNTVFALDAAGQPAKGLGLQISDGSGAVINPNGTSSPMPLLGTPGASNILPFIAAYKVTDKVTAGDANASIQFSVIYH